ncbi:MULTISPECIES: glycosyltransferase [unclassified Cryobacterium]|uniref:glycosyltransferase n=1 Tax=unclassified Cryobacterium TaxID=2649013 RepID=UPI002AB374DE|nr:MULTISPECIES: glycosyltransferase [unclassified Cryobacterium]MDY7544007.1 glycosyltransferase [Cryobacterium sp. 5B3]MEB0265843.1 glycosyltransferase [Cryobacterium sp. 10I5]MEB0273194.1 glycosyltransferase [Cryobacterium sp. 5B3]
MNSVENRLVIVVRADPVICGHSVEARNLAETALERGFDEVRIVTWPIDKLQASGLPLKPLDSVLPYSKGIFVDRPAPVGDYKVLDGRHLAGVTGRLIELFTDGVPTVCLSLYLTPHTLAVSDAVRAAWGTGLPVNVTTIAEAVGSDVTNVVRTAVEEGRFGAAAHILSSYLGQDYCVAVSEYTRQLIITEAELVDEHHGTRYAAQCRERITISYPAIDADSYLHLDESVIEDVLTARGLERDGYILFLSRLTAAKGVDDLIAGYAISAASQNKILVIAGRGPQSEALRAIAAASPLADRIRFLDDVGDAEKPYLMAGCAAFVLPSKPRPEFVETFGIALAEKMLAGGGPVITTVTGGIGEAVGDHALIIPVEDPQAIAEAIDHAILETTADERRDWADRAREYAMQFDRRNVFDKMFAPLRDTAEVPHQ